MHHIRYCPANNKTVMAHCFLGVLGFSPPHPSPPPPPPWPYVPTAGKTVEGTGETCGCEVLSTHDVIRGIVYPVIECSNDGGVCY